MELSQTSLAVMMIGAVPIGMLLNVIYLMTGTLSNQDSIVKKLMVNLKDFVFLIIAALITVILVYYVNNGDYRYLAPLGTLGGYLISDLLLHRWIIKIRDHTFHFVAILIKAPAKSIWRITIAPLWAKAEVKRMVTQTDHRIKELMQDASNGFENNTEAKA